MNKTWTQDSAAQCETILLRDNPMPFDTISVRVYDKAKPDYPGTAKTVTDLIHSIQTVSTRARKPLFIGEFGASRTLGQEAERSQFTAIVKAIKTNRVPLSSIRVFGAMRLGCSPRLPHVASFQMTRRRAF